MNKKPYMIYVNTAPPFDVVKMTAFVQSLHTQGYIDGWWHYLPGGFYLINTHLSVNEIYNLVIKHVPQRQLLVMEVNPHNKQGWLIKQAWDWFSALRG